MTMRNLSVRIITILLMLSSLALGARAGAGTPDTNTAYYYDSNGIARNTGSGWSSVPLPSYTSFFLGSGDSIIFDSAGAYGGIDTNQHAAGSLSITFPIYGYDSTEYYIPYGILTTYGGFKTVAGAIYAGATTSDGYIITFGSSGTPIALGANTGVVQYAAPLLSATFNAGSGPTTTSPAAGTIGDSIYVFAPIVAGSVTINTGSYNYSYITSSSSFGSGSYNIGGGAFASDASITAVDSDLTITTGHDNHSAYDSVVLFLQPIATTNGNIVMSTGNNNGGSPDGGGSYIYCYNTVTSGNDLYITTGDVDNGNVGYGFFIEPVVANNNVYVTTGNNSSSGSYIFFSQGLTSTYGNISLTTGTGNVAKGSYIEFDGLISAANGDIKLATGTGNTLLSGSLYLYGGASGKSISIDLASAMGAAYLLRYNPNNNSVVTNTAPIINVLSSNDPAAGSIFQITGSPNQTLNLGTYTLTASALTDAGISNADLLGGLPVVASIFTFVGSDITVNTSFNGNSGIGNIVMDADTSSLVDGWGLPMSVGNSSSTMDLSGATALAVNLDLQGQYIANGQYALFTANPNGATIVPLNDGVVPAVSILSSNMFYTVTGQLITLHGNVVNRALR